MKDKEIKPKVLIDETKELVEGEDFYYENGLFVFTEKYHLKKGYCCKNKCKHCPYHDWK